MQPVDRILAAAGVQCGHNESGMLVICPPAGVGPTGPADGLLILGGELTGPLPLPEPRDSFIDLGVALFDPITGPPFVPLDRFPDDYLRDLNMMSSVQFGDGS